MEVVGRPATAEMGRKREAPAEPAGRPRPWPIRPQSTAEPSLLLLPLGQPSELFAELDDARGSEGKPKPPNCALAFVATRHMPAAVPIATLRKRRKDGRDVFITNRTPDVRGLPRSARNAARLRMAFVMRRCLYRR